MQKRREFKEKLIAGLIAFMLVFSDFAPLGVSLVSFAADNSADRVKFSAQFVEVETEDNSEEDNPEDNNQEEILEGENSEKQELPEETENSEENDATDSNVSQETDNSDEHADEVISEQETEENSESNEQPEEEIVPEENSEENPEMPESTESTIAIELVIGVEKGGYLKNAKIEMKDLENQIFNLRNGEFLGEYIQETQENKIKLKQINSGTEVRLYIPIELKKEEYVNIKAIQEGMQISLSGTYVDEEGNEEIITKESKAVMNIPNNVDFVVDSQIEKFIPYVKDGVNCALVQLRITGYSGSENELPIKDSAYELVVPEIEGTGIENLSLSAMNTGYTNGLTGSEVIFTQENWSYEFGKVTINIDNVSNDNRYKMNSGKDEFIVSYTYVNCPENMNTQILKSTISAKSNVFTPEGTTEVNNNQEKEYDLSQANSNIITYEVTGKTQEMSKGYLYANSNTEQAQYELEFENAFGVNISRVDLLNIVEVRESAEYFLDDAGNAYDTSNENGINTYYKSVKINKENLLSIIGETGSFELLLENGTSLIQVNKDTEADEDGFVTISFGENRIDKILMRINNPVGEGILNIGAIKAIAKTTYNKNDLRNFRELVNEYVAAAQLQEGIITEMGVRKTAIMLKDTITNATISLNRNELSTLVENENIEMNISLNNANDMSDMYNNPVFELTFPEEVQEINIKDINLLYGNDELEVSNVETFRNDSNNIVVRVTLKGIQTKYTLGDSDKGTTVILKADIKVDMYRASRDSSLIMDYYNFDATNYAVGAEWKQSEELLSYVMIDRQGVCDTSLKIVAPQGFVNAQMISNYKDDGSIISVNQGRKNDMIDCFAEARMAEMKMILINNTDEVMNDVHILGRTIFNGNKEIINNTELGTNQDAPMVSEIVPLDGNNQNVVIYYSENGEATDDLENPENGWTLEVQDFASVKSYLIVVEGQVEIGNILMFAYNFEIPANLTNNLDLCGTFATYYVGEKTQGACEADKVVLSTGDAPVLKVETISDIDQSVATEGQRIKFTVKVSNEGRSVSEATVVNSIIPQGTTYVENGELRPEVKELKIDMGDINPGDSEEVTYEVEVNKSVAGDTAIESNNNVEAKGLEEPIYTTTEAVQVQAAQVNIKLDSDKSGRVLEENNNIYYTTHVTNINSEPLRNCTVVQNIPEGVTVVEAYVEGFREDGVTSYKESEGVYDPNNRTVTWNVDSIVIFKTFKLVVKTDEIEELEKALVTSSKITADNLDREYSSNEVINTLARPQIEVNYYSTNDNKYIKEGDTIQYILEIRNTGKAQANKINIENKIPSELRVTSLKCIKDGSTYSGLSGKNLSMLLSLAPGETANVVMNCTAENLSNTEDERITGNSWVISGNNLTVASTNPIENIIQQNPQAVNNTYENINVKQTNNTKEPSKTVYVAEAAKQEVSAPKQETQKYRILGRAFDDMNHDGYRDDSEEGMADIVVKLCNASSQEIVSQTVTNSIGEYMFEDVVPGEYYIKFEYDTTKYKLTDYKKEGVNSDRNSDAIISNYKAVTDKIKVTDRSMSDIDIGLIRAGIFDLSLDANINKVTVQDTDGTRTYEMENSKLAKVDINPKYANTSHVYVEYTVSVTNKGEIAGYAKRIVDYLPDGLTLDTGMNPNWYVGADGYAYNTELENTLIQPGETKNITLILTKQMTEDGTGIINNTFEIAQSYNEYAIADIDSTEGNRAQGEDDMSSSDIIIGIQTGGGLINIMIISTTLITLLITLYVIKIQVDKKTKGVIV